MLESLQNLTSSTPLPLLGPHLPTLVASTAFFVGVEQLAHKYGREYLGARWEKWEERTRKGWATHVVSMVHAIIIVPLAVHSTHSAILSKDPVFGYDPIVGHVLAFSSGYFIWDTIDSLRNATIGFVVHGACCLAVYLFSFAPFLAGFGPPFLLWEISTPFLNIHWFMDKLNLAAKYPTFYLVNALVFMLVFFLARILYGGYQSIMFFQTMYTHRQSIPIHLHLIYCLGNLALNGLNWLWFSKMVSKMLARLAGEDEPKRSKGTKKTGLGGRTGVNNGVGEKRNGSDDTVGSDGTDGEELVSETLGLPVEPPSPVVSSVPLE